MRISKKDKKTAKSLKDALKFLKKMKIYNGKITGLKKNEIYSALNDYSYDFSSISTKAPRAPRATKATVPYRKRGVIKKAVERYNMYGNTQLEKAIKAEKSKRPKKFGPSLPKGMTYKNLYQTYQNEGNLQLEGKLQNMKKRGRPKGSKNKKK